MTDGQPRRIQFLRGVKGWRKPDGAIFVTHRTRYGNPFYTGPKDDRATARDQFAAWIDGEGDDTVILNGWTYHRPTIAGIKQDLAGHDLVCYCSLDQPCHADILLELAR